MGFVRSTALVRGQMLPSSVVALIGLILACTTIVPAAPWHHPLYLDGTGWWQKRVAVQVSHGGPGPLNGFPIACAVGSAAGQLPLTGQRAESVRVCDARGTEMLFVLHGPDGAVVTEGPIPDRSSLIIPVECPPGGKALYYVYFDNPGARAVPDFLAAQPGLVNGDVEWGEGDAPTGWSHDAPDDRRRAMWSTEHPQSGLRCLKTVVADGAEPTWIATRQRDIAIVGGAKYRFQAWVKAEHVRGFCGWYLHVGNDRQSMVLAPMLSAGDGTFDWKRVDAEFTAPAEADRLSLGTVLRGTGVAWFDNADLQCLSPEAIQTQVLTAESLSVREIGADAGWYGAGTDASAAGSHPYRAVVRALNLSDTPRQRTAVVTDLGRLRARLRGRFCSDSILVTLAGRPVEHRLLGDQLLWAAELPARSSSVFHLYYAPGESSDDDHRVREINSEWLDDSALNLVRNSGFERGEPFPESWTASGISPRDGVALSVDSTQREASGARCARMHVPADAPRAWRGWHQNVPVQPGRSYLFSAWVKCQDVRDGEVRLHAHYRQADGQLSQRGGFASVGPSISGTTDWTLMSGTLVVPDDAVTCQLHLTMETRGTVWHDRVTLVEVTRGDLMGIESRRKVPSGELAVWQVPAVVKVFQDDVPPDDPGLPAAGAEISSARNEQESLQLAVRSGRDVRGMQVHVEPPVGPQGFALQDFRVEVVGCVPIDHRSSYFQTNVPAWHRKVPTGSGRGDGWAGMWPDPLLPTDACDLQAGVTQPVWVTVRIPSDAPAGRYEGRVRMEAGGEVLAAVALRVHVWNFTLPDQTHLAAIYDVRLGAGEKLWGKSLDEAYPEIIRFLAARRLCPDTIRPGPVFRRVDGKITADFTAFDDAARVYFDELKFPMAYTPWDLYLFGWGHPPKTVFGERPYDGEFPFESADRSRLRPEYKQVYQEKLRLFWEHLREKGWHRRVVLYISDEPFDRQEHIRHQMRALCDMIHEVDPEIPIYSSTWHHVPDWDGYLDVWGIGHYGVVSPEKMARLRADGARIWFTTDGQMCTDTPYCAVERLLPHYCFQYGAEAYEFWGVSWYTYDPYRFGWHAFIHQSGEPGQSTWVRYPNGDGFLLYPGQPIGHDGPVSSIRLEQAREGVEDYEYLRLLGDRMEAAKRAGQATTRAEQAWNAARELVQIPNAGGYTSTRILPRPERLEEVRRLVAEAIESLPASAR